MTIRKMTNEDMDAVVRIFMDAYNGLPWDLEWEYDAALKYLEECKTFPGYAGFVACNSNEVIGGMFTHTKTWWSGDQLIVDEVFLARTAQGLGHGNALMQHIEEYSKSIGLGMVILMTNRDMPALDFYLKTGYNKVEQYICMYKLL